jgi:hypothetical protein
MCIKADSHIPSYSERVKCNFRNRLLLCLCWTKRETQRRKCCTDALSKEARQCLFHFHSMQKARTASWVLNIGFPLSSVSSAFAERVMPNSGSISTPKGRFLISLLQAPALARVSVMIFLWMKQHESLATRDETYILCM